MSIVYGPCQIDAKLDKRMHRLASDVQKMNLFWLVQPKFGKVPFASFAKNKTLIDIDNHMSKDVRSNLCLPPGKFVVWWQQMLDRLAGTPLIVKHFPNNHIEMMWSRVSEFNERTVRVEGNVLSVDFATLRPVAHRA